MDTTDPNQPIDIPLSPTPNLTPPPAKILPLKKIFILLAIILLLPGIFIALRYRQTLNTSAKGSPCIPISKININPGKIETYITAPPIEISVLAYSTDDQPIFKQVQYKWGMSSTNSIGSLKPKQEIALFAPKQIGTGNIWVNAKNACTKDPIQISIPIVVTEEPLPTIAPTPTTTPPLTIKKVFITSSSFTGFLGGLNGADAECQRHANIASISGTWKAWLSSDTVSVSNRMSKTNAIYKRIDDAIVANSWTDFVDGTFENPINVSEKGTTVNSSWVWTNSTATGEIRQAENNSCLNWNSTSSGGGTGDSTRTDSGWSSYGASACIYARPLYCIEQ